MMPIRRLLPLAAVALAALVLAGCSSGDGSGGDRGDAAATSSTSGGAPADTTPTTAAPTTTTVATPQSLPPGLPPNSATDATAQAAGQRLIDAWVQDDIVTASAVAGSDVANALFSYPAPFEVQTLPCRGSETVDGATECDYSDTTGTVTLLITGNAHNGYRVTNVGFVPSQQPSATTVAP